METFQTQKYAFVLGRERDLCLAELKAVLARFGFCFDNLSLSGNVAFINLDIPVSESAVSYLANVLGGTIKIFRIISSGRSPVERSCEISPTSPEAMSRNDNTHKNIIEEYIRSHAKNDGKFNYAISSYSRVFNLRSINNLGLSIKKDLKKELSLRFVELREGIEVSSILSFKSKLATLGFEFGLFESGEIGILVGLSDPEEWSRRDYDKPAGDKYSGMLPPKLARMMINIALGQGQFTDHSLQSTGKKTVNRQPSTVNCLVVDPFCGSGNIPIEALMLGCDVFASDVSEKAVRDTKANIEWLKNVILSKAKNPSTSSGQVPGDPSTKSQDDMPKVEIVQADAINADFTDLLSTVNRELSTYDHFVVVTEPFLGEPKKYKPSMNAARGEYRKVKETYIEFLKNIASLSVISNGSEKSPKVMGSLASVQNLMARDDTKNFVLCIVFPLVETAEGQRYSLFAESVDEIKKIGYTILRPPLIYGRDYQVVKREIVLLQF